MASPGVESLLPGPEDHASSTKEQKESQSAQVLLRNGDKLNFVQGSMSISAVSDAAVLPAEPNPLDPAQCAQAVSKINVVKARVTDSMIAMDSRRWQKAIGADSTSRGLVERG